MEKKNILLKIQYDGTNFNGSQVQKSGRTVQGVLNQAILASLKENPKLYFSGRTDSGVHAREQYLNFYTEATIPADKIFYAIRRFLPDDIAILSSKEVPKEFNSRFDAKKRVYRYYLTQKEDLFQRKYSLIYPYNFDLNYVNSFAKYFIGKKNFKSFCSSRCEVKHHFCEVEYLKFQRQDSNTIYLEIGANRYLQNMIRILMATFLEINQRRIDENKLLEIFAAEDRRAAPKTLSPKGLFLWKIYY